MNVHKLWTDDRAVSPVVGVALLIAITVILAAVIGGVVLGLGTGSTDAPQASLQFEYNGTDLTIHHAGGEVLDADHIVLAGDVNDASPLNDDLRAGNSEVITSGLTDGDKVSVVWQDPNSNDEAVLATFEYKA